jgi:hypothetical protein
MRFSSITALPIPPRLALGALLLATPLLGSCTSWRIGSTTPEAVVARKPYVIRVVRQDGVTEQLYASRFEGDSLIGMSSPEGHARRISIPLADIHSVAVQRLNIAKTAVLLAGAGVTAAIIASALKSDPPPVVQTGGSGDFYYSCPLVYSWTTGGWRLDSGTFGGAISAGLARTDVDNLLFASADAGIVRLKLANEMHETDHVDAVALLAVDHPAGTTIAPDPDGGVHTLGPLTRPLTARDYRGHDALPRIGAVDGWSWESIPSGRDQARDADIRDGLELQFARPERGRPARLVIDANITPWATYLMGRFVGAHGAATSAWYDSLDTRPLYAAAVQRALASEAFLSVLVQTDTGWVRQGIAWDVGPEISKRQVVALDLRGVTGPTVRVRVESVPSFWLIDAVALDQTADQRIRLQELAATSAVTGTGRDVRPLLASADNTALVMETGDTAILRFAAPALRPGQSRSYLLRTHGWYRLHTGTGAPPDLVLLRTVERARLGISRAATAQLAAAVAASAQ